MPRSRIELTTSRLHSFIMAKVSHAHNHSAMEVTSGHPTSHPMANKPFNKASNNVLTIKHNRLFVNQRRVCKGGVAPLLDTSGNAAVNDRVKITLTPYFRILPLFHVTTRLHLTGRLLKFMQWFAIQQYLYWNVPCWGHQLWDINCCMCVCVCVCVSVCPPTYRYIAPRMIQRIILTFCGYVGCDDATNVSNFGYEPIKFNQLNQ